jgi:hypothetical protein
MDGIGASGTGDACGHVGLHCFSRAPGKGRADRYAPATLRAMDRAGAAHGRLVCAPALDSFAPRPFSLVAASVKPTGAVGFTEADASKFSRWPWPHQSVVKQCGKHSSASSVLRPNASRNHSSLQKEARILDRLLIVDRSLHELALHPV